MAQPEFLSDGVTPRLTDGKLLTLKKWLGVWQNKGGALSANNPRITDGERVTEDKILCAKKGIAYPGV